MIITIILELQLIEVDIQRALLEEFGSVPLDNELSAKIKLFAHLTTLKTKLCIYLFKKDFFSDYMVFLSREFHY